MSVRLFTRWPCLRLSIHDPYARSAPSPVSFTSWLAGSLARWLAAVGITTVAMESTGVYWIPVFEILESYGLEVLLVNARGVKNVPGRKTDVSDAQWIQKLHEHGLLRGSFRPSEEISPLRAYLRVRERLVESAASHIQHMHKALMQMNVQLQHVVSDVAGVTGMRIIRAIVAGERDPDVLSAFRDARCKSSIDTIRAALCGNYRPEHVFALQQALELYDVYQTKMAECDEEIVRVLRHLNERRPGGSGESASQGPRSESQAKERTEFRCPICLVHVARGRSDSDPRRGSVSSASPGCRVRQRYESLEDSQALHLLADTGAQE